MSNGLILYEGPSLLDGEPIVVIATGLRTGSTNTKTGAMIQTYILRSDMPPSEAVKTGNDESICGSCPHRGDGTGKGRSCYVTLFHGPRGVYEAYKRGSYPKHRMHVTGGRVGTGRTVRLGTYGDPAAVPKVIWDDLLDGAVGWTGYTHQWRGNQLSGFLMASVDSVDEMHEAHALGYRTFRVSAGTDVEPEELVCPASAEAGKRTTCENCQLCAGLHTRSRKSIVIAAHGSGKRYVTAT